MQPIVINASLIEAIDHAIHSICQPGKEIMLLSTDNKTLLDFFAK